MFETQELDLHSPSGGSSAQQGTFALLGALSEGAPDGKQSRSHPFGQELSQRDLLPVQQTHPQLEGRVTGPVRLIQVISQAWGLSNQELANLLAYPNKTLIPALLEGRMTFVPNPDRADRLRIMYSVHATLADLFVDGAHEARWLRDRLPILDNLAPLECMLQRRIPGMLMVQDLVERRMANR